ncbi:unnamed protein product [Amoebophrya sp. A25]|nr:unnamed protein product [Amoebophrya sp. A25]|eukprot:GSA25T00003311001.1
MRFFMGAGASKKQKAAEAPSPAAEPEPGQAYAIGAADEGAQVPAGGGETKNGRPHYNNPNSRSNDSTGDQEEKLSRSGGARSGGIFDHSGSFGRREDDVGGSASDEEAEVLESILKERVAQDRKRHETRPRGNKPSSNIHSRNGSRHPSPLEDGPGGLSHGSENRGIYNGQHRANNLAPDEEPATSKLVRSRQNSAKERTKPSHLTSNGGGGSNMPSPKSSGGAGSMQYGGSSSSTAKHQPAEHHASGPSPTFGGSGGSQLNRSITPPPGASPPPGRTSGQLNAFMNDSDDDAPAFGGGGKRGGSSRASQPQPLGLVLSGFVPQGENQIAVTKNEVVKVIDTSHAEEYGWIWCESTSRPGEQGWVPSHNLDLNYKGKSRVSEISQGGGPGNGGFLADAGTPPQGGGDSASSVGGADDDPLAQWNDKLAESFVLHSMRNLVRLVQYVVNLLNPYGAATSLHIACWRGSIDAVEVMIESDPDLIKRLHATAGQLTPLHVATICNYPEVVQFLLDAKANCNIPTVHELSPLHLAASANSELVEILVQARANVDAEDADGNTPLIFACCYHQVQTIEYLVDKQADSRKCNRWDVSPLHLAAAYAELDGSLYSIQLLCSTGADPWLKDAGNLTPLQTIKRVLKRGGRKSLSSGPGSTEALDPVLEFLEQFTSVTKLKPAARQAVLKKRRRDREAREAREADEGPTSTSGQRRKSDALILQDDETGKDEHDDDGATPQNVVKASTIAAELQQENQKLSNDARDLRREVESLRSQLKQAESATSANKDLASQMSQQRRDQEREFEKRQTERDRDFQKQLKKLEADLEEKDKTWGKKLEDEKVRLKKLNEEITAQLVQKTEKKSSGDVAALNVKMQGLESDLRASKSSLDSKLAEITALKSDLSKAREERQKGERTLQTDLDAKKERVRVLESELRQLKTTLETTETELENAKQNLKNLDEFTERAERAERALRPLEERNIELERMFAEEQAIRRKYHNQIQELKGAIRVYCRIRPRISKEVNAGEECWLGKLDEFSTHLKRGERREDKEYNFDGIFDENNTQEQVFKDCKDLIQSAVDGFNITIFAYGQTGAGKTYTMYGGEGEHGGLVPRTIKEIFAIKTKNANRYEIKVKFYMLEVYRDELQDLLLFKKKPPGPLEIKRDSRGTIYIENVSEIEVQTADELQSWLEKGMDKRHVAATKMNTDSSRSHLICTILLEVYNRSKKTTALGKISLVDLAGSERLKKSEASGETAKEAMAINKSLTALGDVIEALTTKQKHIPYRNHKLTELMSDSLGGNAKTLMFANCSPAASNSEESMSTLNYASRAKNITNNVSKQQESKEVSRLKQVIATMSREMSMRTDLQAPDQAGLQAALLGT